MRPRSRKRKRTAGKRNADFSPFQRTAGPSKKRSAGTRSQPKGVPAQAQRSGLRGERTSNGVSEPCRLRRGEGYGVCEADGAVQRGLGALPPTSRLDLPLWAGGPICLPVSPASVSLVPGPYSKGASTEAIKYADAILVQSEGTDYNNRNLLILEEWYMTLTKF